MAYTRLRIHASTARDLRHGRGARCRVLSGEGSFSAVFSFVREVSRAKTEFDPVQFRSFRKDGRLTARVSINESNPVSPSFLPSPRA